MVDYYQEHSQDYTSEFIGEFDDLDMYMCRSSSSDDF